MWSNFLECLICTINSEIEKPPKSAKRNNLNSDIGFKSSKINKPSINHHPRIGPLYQVIRNMYLECKNYERH